MEFNNLSEKIQKLVIDKNYDILRDKALVLQEKSIDACRGDEDYDIPDFKLNNAALEVINKGVQQIINYKGLSFQAPFEGLGISDFYFLMDLFCFDMRRQRAYHYDEYSIDEILFKHSKTSFEIWLVNKVLK